MRIAMTGSLAGPGISWPKLLGMARLLVAGLLLCGASAGPSPEECLALGFTDTLSCGQCQKMGEFVKDEALLADCSSCCNDDSDSATTYASAVLEVCS
jgi:hypothetical protein